MTQTLGCATGGIARRSLQSRCDVCVEAAPNRRRGERQGDDDRRRERDNGEATIERYRRSQGHLFSTQRAKQPDSKETE